MGIEDNMNSGNNKELVYEIDATGLACPMPVLKASAALRQMPAGAELSVICSDKASWRDFQHFAKTSGHILVEQSELADGRLCHILRKKKSD